MMKMQIVAVHTQVYSVKYALFQYSVLIESHNEVNKRQIVLS